MYDYKRLLLYAGTIILIFLVFYNYFASFVAIIGSLLYAILGLYLFAKADDKVLGNVNTYDEIVNKQNISYAIALLTIAIIISAGIISGSLIFYSLR
jgi:hypothetical protein